MRCHPPDLLDLMQQRSNGFGLRTATTNGPSRRTRFCIVCCIQRQVDANYYHLCGGVIVVVYLLQHLMVQVFSFHLSISLANARSVNCVPKPSASMLPPLWFYATKSLSVSLCFDSVLKDFRARERLKLGRPSNCFDSSVNHISLRANLASTSPKTTELSLSHPTNRAQETYLRLNRLRLFCSRLFFSLLLRVLVA